MMAMAILVTHSATETEARPQLQHQPQQPAHSEEAFFPEPSVQWVPVIIFAIFIAAQRHSVIG